MLSPPVSAATLKENLSELVNNHKRIMAAQANLAASVEKIRVARGRWFPTMGVTGHYGGERQLKGNSTKDTNATTREVDLSLTQLLWDFGATNANIDIARLDSENAETALTATRQGLLLEGVIAYLTMFSTNKILDFARSSEANIKRQTELEDARVQRGAGLSTDVLQAKAQLAGAQARRVRAKGAMVSAHNRFRAVFGKVPESIGTLVKPRAPIELLPETLEEAIKIALESNPRLKTTLIAEQFARANVRKTMSSEFYPTINAVAESKYKDDVAGTLGIKHEQLIKVEMAYSLNLGLTAINTLRASKDALISSTNQHGDTRDTVEEQVRNAWQNLLTSREIAEFLKNQANIAGEFLELARKERKLGQRSLIDVLSGETQLINSSSDFAAAETQVDITIYTLLAVMGQLEMNIIE